MLDKILGKREDLNLIYFLLKLLFIAVFPNGGDKILCIDEGALNFFDSIQGR